MTNRKPRPSRLARPPLLSPGRPPVAGRKEQRRFWAAIATGISSEGAAVAFGVPQAIGTRWFRKAGGMPPAIFRRSAKPLSGRYLSLAERGSGDPACAGRGGAGDGPADETVGVDDLAGATPQCHDPQRGPGLPGNHGAVACRPSGPAPETSEAGGQRRAAQLCAGSIGRRCRHAKRDCDCRTFGILERSSTRTSAGSAMGIGMEPRADCSSPTARFSPR